MQRRFTYGRTIRTTTWISALLFPLFLIAPNIIAIGLILGISFIGGATYNVVQFSYRISLIPDQLQGRVNSSFRLIAIGSQPIGAALAGILIEQFGAQYAILVYAILFLILAIAATLSPSLRNAKQVGHGHPA